MAQYGKICAFRVECGPSPGDEIGNHARLKIACRKAWEFKSPPGHNRMPQNKAVLAYIIGVSLGDGNLSNPNGRAVRLRISCDKKYPNLIFHIQENLQKIFPKNKVSLVNREKYNVVDVSCYSNNLEELLGWKVGSKVSQSVSIPKWILKSEKYSRECLRGLLQTDGSIYKDRGYVMVNFTTIIKPLSENVMNILDLLGYKPQIRKVPFKGKFAYIVRVSKNTSDLITDIDLWKN